MSIPFGGSTGGSGILIGGIPIGGGGAAGAWYPDSITVYPPVAGTDADGGPADTTGTGVAMTASVNRTSVTGLETRRREDFGGVQGMAAYDIRVADGSAVTQSDQRIEWTATSLGALS